MDAKSTGNRGALKPLLGIALVSLLLCGILFPLLVTGIAQVMLPYQANGEIVRFNGRAAGSQLISQNFPQPVFFHPRNDSASGADPDITLQDAYLQISRISGATGIPAGSLAQLVEDHTDAVSKLFGNSYVNVLDLNLALIRAYPSVYGSYR